MKIPYDLFEVVAVPDGFVFKFVGKPDELHDLLYAKGFDVKFLQEYHTIKLVSDNSWCMDGWLNWGFVDPTRASVNTWANRDALLRLIKDKFGCEYDKVELPITGYRIGGEIELKTDL